jgi:xanthine dehydrogenase accessory factor
LENTEKTVVVRGGGDLATGVLWRLHRVGFRVVCLESPLPTAIRRTVSAAEAVFAGENIVEGLQFVRLEPGTWPTGKDRVPVWIDPDGLWIKRISPDSLVDAIMAKRNLGTSLDMAPRVVALGPGFYAGRDVHCVVETKRGHNLGRVIYNGCAAPNTGIPGVIGGESEKRIVRAPCDGFFSGFKKIGDNVCEGQILGTVNELPVLAKFTGIVRGLIHPSVPVHRGMKIGDIDPRTEEGNWKTISDKALSIAGGVLEAVLADIPGT